MKKILLSNLKEGEILAKDIFSDKGLLILKQGTALNDKLIKRIVSSKLKSQEAGEPFVYIENESAGEDGDNGETVSFEMIKKRDEELDLLEKRFEKVRGLYLMDEIKDAIKSAIIKNYGGK